MLSSSLINTARLWQQWQKITTIFSVALITRVNSFEFESNVTWKQALPIRGISLENCLLYMWHRLWALYNVIMIAFSTEYISWGKWEKINIVLEENLWFSKDAYASAFTVILSGLVGQYPYYDMCCAQRHSIQVRQSSLHSDLLRLQYEVARYFPSPRHWVAGDKPYFQAPSAALPAFRPVIVLQKCWIQHVHISFIQAGQPMSSQFLSDNKFDSTKNLIQFHHNEFLTTSTPAS